MFDFDACDQTITVTGPGELKFPNNGLAHYPPLALCTFSLTASTNEHILFSFNYLNVSTGDLLSVLDTNGRLISGTDPFSETKPPEPTSHLSLGNVIDIIFESDADWIGEGFEITYNTGKSQTADGFLPFK